MSCILQGPEMQCVTDQISIREPVPLQLFALATVFDHTGLPVTSFIRNGQALQRQELEYQVVDRRKDFHRRPT